MGSILRYYTERGVYKSSLKSSNECYPQTAPYTLNGEFVGELQPPAGGNSLLHVLAMQCLQIWTPLSHLFHTCLYVYIPCVISGFRRSVNENFALLACYAA
jgi:hypothetical protein